MSPYDMASSATYDMASTQENGKAGAAVAVAADAGAGDAGALYDMGNENQYS
eukprot:m.198547 g.198547  ORF g.198547 m.198547 type:complete len:52 (+) comp17675_c0_seq13:424-579(+)